MTFISDERTFIIGCIKDIKFKKRYFLLYRIKAYNTKIYDLLDIPHLFFYIDRYYHVNCWTIFIPAKGHVKSKLFW